jgi:biopolymer transport protein ExbB
MIQKRTKWIWSVAAGVMLVLAAAGTAWAQEAGEAAPPAQQLTFNEMVRSGGWPMFVLAGLSVAGVACIVYFFLVIRAGQVVPRPLRRALLEQAREGALEDARKACDFRPCPLAAVAAAGLDHILETGRRDPSLLKDILEGEGSRQAELIQGPTQYLYDIAVIAPMVGLLGTVLGMLRAFASVALNEAAAKPVVLAEGVSQALITTAFGLMVGIPAMMFYAYFRRRAARLTAHLEIAVAELLTALSTGIPA